MASQIVAEVARSALGPKDVDSLGDVTISRDELTVIDKMDIHHSAGEIMGKVKRHGTAVDETGPPRPLSSPANV